MDEVVAWRAVALQQIEEQMIYSPLNGIDYPSTGKSQWLAECTLFAESDSAASSSFAHEWATTN